MCSIRITSKEPITDGWSCDTKYRATAEDGTSYFLRITPKEKSGTREALFQMLKQVEQLGIPMCRPVEYGACPEGVYILLTWINGEDARTTIPKFPVSEQYSLGREAGAILKKIHSIPAPESQPEWESRFNQKIDRNIRMYHDCPIRFEGDSHLLRYIAENRHLLKNRPQCFQHGDFHIGNMMIENGKIVIIDFDRFDFGDPWEEFNRIVWCAQEAPHFAAGITDGYFDDRIPNEFWRLLALYIGSNTFSSVPWAIPFGEKEISVMLNQAKDVLSWYDNMKNAIPRWYTKVKKSR